MTSVAGMYWKRAECPTQKCGCLSECGDQSCEWLVLHYVEGHSCAILHVRVLLQRTEPGRDSEWWEAHGGAEGTICLQVGRISPHTNLLTFAPPKPLTLCSVRILWGVCQSLSSLCTAYCVLASQAVNPQELLIWRKRVGASPALPLSLPMFNVLHLSQTGTDICTGFQAFAVSQSKSC